MILIITNNISKAGARQKKQNDILLTRSHFFIVIGHND